MRLMQDERNLSVRTDKLATRTGCATLIAFDKTEYLEQALSLIIGEVARRLHETVYQFLFRTHLTDFAQRYYF